MKKIYGFIAICFCWMFSLSSHVLIFTYAYNRPDFIEIQHATLKKFVSDEYVFVVFNDANNNSMAQNIEHTCSQLGILHVRIPQEIHNRPYLERLPREDYHAPAVRNVNVVMYSLREMGFNHDDILVLLDSDLFVVKPVSFRALLKEHDIAAMQIGNGYVQYLWHGLCCLNMKKLPNIRTLNFNCGRIDGHPIDAGGYSYYYLHNNPQVPVKYVNYFHTNHFRCSVCEKDDMSICTHNEKELRASPLMMSDYLIHFLQRVHNVDFYHDCTFFHYRGGTNWDGKNAAYIHNKTNAFNQFIRDSLAAYS